MDFEKLYEMAREEGLKAGREKHVEPVYLTDGVRKYVLEDGLCGFASIHFLGNTSFGRWAKNMGYARKHYEKGLCIFVSEFNQSYERKVAYASAFVKVLRENGIESWITERLD